MIVRLYWRESRSSSETRFLAFMSEERTYKYLTLSRVDLEALREISCDAIQINNFLKYRNIQNLIMKIVAYKNFKVMSKSLIDNYI